MVVTCWTCNLFTCSCCLLCFIKWYICWLFAFDSATCCLSLTSVIYLLLYSDCCLEFVCYFSPAKKPSLYHSNEYSYTYSYGLDDHVVQTRSLLEWMGLWLLTCSGKPGCMINQPMDLCGTLHDLHQGAVCKCSNYYQSSPEYSIRLHSHQSRHAFHFLYYFYCNISCIYVKMFLIIKCSFKGMSSKLSQILKVIKTRAA